MTMELLERIIKENNIPKNVHLMSDSGWECDATEMDGIFYNRQNNTIVFTQGEDSNREYGQSEEWEILYAPDLIKIGELEVYSAFCSCLITEEFKKELKAAGDFENFYGIPESEDLYKKIDLQKPLYYSIKIKNRFVGYIGFHGDDMTLEPEIYIFKQYRHKGYGTRVLKRFIDIAFNEGLIKIWREKNVETTFPAYIWKKEKIYPSKFVSTVRVENEYSKKMMFACGFHKNKNIAVEFLLFLDDKGSKDNLIQISEFELKKEDWSCRK